MIDSNEQDAYEEDLKNIDYNKAIEALIPVVKLDPTVFDAFIFEEYPDIYNEADEEELVELHRFCSGQGHTVPKWILDSEIIPEMVRKYLGHVEDEARRRADG